MADALRGRAMTAGLGVQVVGPAPAYVARRAERWRYNVVLRGPGPRRPARSAAGRPVVGRRRSRVAALGVSNVAARGICKARRGVLQRDCKRRLRSCRHTGAMPDRVLRGLRSVLLAVAVTALVIVGRVILDQLVGPRGWYVLLFAGVFVTARYAGLRTADRRRAPRCRLAPRRAGGGRPRTAPWTRRRCSTSCSISPPVPRRSRCSSLVERTGRRLRASDLTAEAREGELRAPRPARRRGATARPGVRDAAVRPAARRPVRPPGSIDGGGRRRGGPRRAVEQRPRRRRAQRRAARAWTAGRPRRPRSSAGSRRRRAPADRSVPTTRSSCCRCSPGRGRSPSRRSRCPRGRPLEDEELEGLLLLGRIIGEAMARSELNAVSRRDAGRASEAATADRPAPGARRLARPRARRRGDRPARGGRRLGRDGIERRRPEPRGRRPRGARAAPCARLPGGPPRARAPPAAPRQPARPDRRPHRPRDPRRRRRVDGRVPGSQRPARRWPGSARSSRCPSAGRRRSRCSSSAGPDPRPTTTTTSASSTRSPSTPPRRSAARSSSTSSATATAASA